MIFETKDKLLEYIKSDNYKQDMMTASDESFYYRQDDAEGMGTDNYNFRHHENFRKTIGVWRWKPMFLHRECLTKILFDENNTVLDFGGATAPVSPHVDVVDIQKVDIFNRPVKYSKLSDCPDVDVIFSSHTLEHIDNFDQTVNDLLFKCRKYLILNLPSYTNRRWHPDVFPGHVRKFCLNNNDSDSISIDKIIEHKVTDMIIKEYSGDNCITIVAKI